MSKGEKQTFLEHVYELRSRLFWITLVLLAGSAIGFYAKDLLVEFVMAPLDGEKLVYLTPGGGFSFIFTVCLYFGALVTIPVVMYHIYRFLQPVLGRVSRKLVASILLLSAVLAASGAIFGYAVAIPGAIQFLTTFAGDAVVPSLTAESYLGFVVAYMLGLAVLFQLPLLLYIVDHVKPFPPGGLTASQRYVVAGSILAAAVITPTPDIINQAIVAGPIILVYQLGAIAVFVRHRAQQRRTAKATMRRRATSVSLESRGATETTEKTLAVPAESAVTAHVPQPKVATTPLGFDSHATQRQYARPTPHRQPAKPRRSMDGFVAKPIVTLSKPTVQPVPRRRLQSIDGLSLVG